MVLDGVFRPFVEQSAVTVMMRGVLEYALPRKRIDELFREHARRQYEGELLFSSVVDLLGTVVCGVHKSTNAAYLASRWKFEQSVISFYKKMQGVETPVSQALVRESATKLREVLSILDPQRQPILPGYHVKILDGNHLASTEHRIKETRWTRSGPLPGQSLVVLDPLWMLVCDVFPCEDGHAQERSILPEVLETVQPGDLWLADRNFCTSDFTWGIADAGAHFLIRQHASTLHGKKLLGKRRLVGRSSTGTVYEQQLRVTDKPGKRTQVLRRITVVLDKPTTDGEKVIYLVSNVPPEAADAIRLAEMYLLRWRIENAFQHLDQAFRGELNTLGYPKAALLGFCIALYTYNVLCVLKTALFVVHGDQAALSRLSDYYLAAEIESTYRGMIIAIEPERWETIFGKARPRTLAQLMLELAAAVRINQFFKNTRGPKKKPPKRTSGKRNHHVSTARLIANRKK